MTELEQKISDAKAGQIIPLVRQIDVSEPVDFFARLSDYGRKQHCCLLESRDHLAEGDQGELTFGTANPALYVSGSGADFQIVALSPTGKRMIKYFATAGRSRFDFCKEIKFENDRITGRLNLSHDIIDEQSRLKAVNQMDVIRAVNFAFELSGKPFRVTCGLLGALSYDFIDQFEKLPKNENVQLDVPDYELYFADNIFLMDHKTGDAFVIVNAIVTDDDKNEIMTDAENCFDYYFKTLKTETPQPKKYTGSLPKADTDTQQGEYEKMVQTAKKHITDGDIFQVVLSRTITEPCPDEPLDVYKRLRQLNPSPYMFYINTPNTVLAGASPELNLRVSGTKNRKVEIRPIAGTKPRGKINGKIDPDTDFRYEAELKLDRKELAEHMMLVDLARNDIARVTQKGSRIVDELLIVEKYESVMHLVSNVKGTLADELDALSAYLATMNMGTLTGAPKIEAMKIIRQLEKNKRGYYGGAVMYLTVDGQFDSCITIRSLQVKDHIAYVRAGAGIVYDSVPKTEFEETQHKANSCLRAVRGK
ncbi:MAG: anthranilate synthase component 1 [Planctomycetes bacterium]|nr:anthranilate synthase component 1 [Planctomycetota bacterium]MBU1517693.1 anthranilate synthase component 1 [Planctomycetota bacterium]MBU2597207.1 anthranilate synthase component 1 [Planctomycetota bacterium]